MKRTVGFVLLGCVVIAICVGFFVYPKRVTYLPTNLQPTMMLPYDPVWNYRQSVNACGPYSAAAVMRLVKHETVSSEDIANTTPWRFRGYTMPFGVAGVLRARGVPSDEVIVKGSDDDKREWLEAQLSNRRPVILLGRKNGLLHYVTVVGYTLDPNLFYVYDSLEEKGENGLTADKNGNAPGNAVWTSDELLDFWRAGGVLGLYRFYAIVPQASI